MLLKFIFDVDIVAICLITHATFFNHLPFCNTNEQTVQLAAGVKRVTSVSYGLNEIRDIRCGLFFLKIIVILFRADIFHYKLFAQHQYQWCIEIIIVCEYQRHRR